MASLNRCTLIGNLGADPELRYTQNQTPVASFSIATTESWTGDDGQKQEKTDWHRIVAWKKTAEICQKYLTKGKQVYIEGRISTRKWQNKDGVDQYTTEITADKVLFLGSAPESRREEPRQSKPQQAQANQPPPSEGAAPVSSDIPFMLRLDEA